mgnify:CR=1 FL=1
MKKEIEENLESLGLAPVVSLVVVDEFGRVKLLEQIGDDILASFLKAASKIEDNPITEDSYLIDCRGQEVYVLESYDYFKSIVGCFLSCSSIKELTKACSAAGLRFSFIVSY